MRQQTEPKASMHQGVILTVCFWSPRPETCDNHLLMKPREMAREYGLLGLSCDRLSNTVSVGVFSDIGNMLRTTNLFMSKKFTSRDLFSQHLSSPDRPRIRLVYSSKGPVRVFQSHSPKNKSPLGTPLIEFCGES